MELRKLKSLLSALQSAGVTSYQEGDLRLTFGAPLPPVPEGDVEGTEQDWASGAPLGLQRAVEQIRKQYEPKPKGKTS